MDGAIGADCGEDERALRLEEAKNPADFFLLSAAPGGGLLWFCVVQGIPFSPGSNRLEARGELNAACPNWNGNGVA